MNRERRDRAVEDLRSEAGGRRRRSRRRRDLGAFAGLGPALRRLRLRQGASQRQVAEAAGLTRPMISAYERGLTQPSVTTLGRLLDALEVTLGELEEALGEPRRPHAGRDGEAGRAGS